MGMVGAQRSGAVGSAYRQPGTGEAQIERHLFLLTEGLSIEAKFAERLGEVGGEPMEGVNLFRRYLLHQLDQVRKIGMVAQGEGCSGLATKAAIRIDSPTGQNRRP